MRGINPHYWTNNLCLSTNLISYISNYVKSGGYMVEERAVVLWMPHIIFSDKDIAPAGKLILTEILNLLRVNRQHCWASNEHFAEMFGLSKRNVSYHIDLLSKSGWIISKAIKECDLDFCTLRETGWHRHIVAGETLSKILDGLSGKSTDPMKNTSKPMKYSSIPYEVDKADKYIHINNNEIIDKSIGETPKSEYGNEEINDILKRYEVEIGSIPTDKRPRAVAQNIRQIIKSFIARNARLFLEVRGTELTFDYVLTRSWNAYKTKRYYQDTEKLETFKLKMKAYLADAEKKLQREGGVRSGVQEDGKRAFTRDGRIPDHQAISVLAQAPRSRTTENSQGLGGLLPKMSKEPRR